MADLPDGRSAEELREALLRAEAEITALRAQVGRRSGSPSAGRRPASAPRPASGGAGPRAVPQPLPLASDQFTLFRILFRGREDVYAVRWQADDGRSGYAPATRHPREPAGTRYLPLTDRTIGDHLRGTCTVGIYPLLPDDTCWFVAADFDDAAWQDDAAGFVDACAELDIPVATERSRSGRGAHAWIFFEAPVRAAVARNLASTALTRATERRHLSLRSYDRLFPSQDVLPRGGLGNLIALPLQPGPMLRGHSLFVDRTWTPHPDQWAFLRGVRRMPVAEALAIVGEAQRSGAVLGVGVGRRHPEATPGVEPWDVAPSGRLLEPRAAVPAAPLPSPVPVTLSNLAYINVSGLPEPVVGRLIRLAAFPNPEFYRAQALRRSTWNKPRIVHGAEDARPHLGLPRGCWDDARALLEAAGAAVAVEDRRVTGDASDLHFAGQLTALQREAADAIVAWDSGVLCAPAGFGKTVVAAALIARRAVPALVLVESRALLRQWRELLAILFGVDLKDVGQIGGGRRRPTGRIDVATIASLVGPDGVDDAVADYGHVVMDECHHAGAPGAERLLRFARARYVLGLTATPFRADGMHPIMEMQCGPIRWRPSPAQAAELRPAVQRVIRRNTGFPRPAAGEAAEDDIHALYAALAGDERRNALICADLLAAVDDGRTPILLTGRRDHVDILVGLISDRVEHLVVLTGGCRMRQRREEDELLRAIPAGGRMAIVATGRYVGEGFNLPRLDTLLLGLPVAWHGTVEQYVGRIQRQSGGKEAVTVYDYVDEGVPVLERMFRKRVRGYANAGFQIDGDGAPGRSSPRRPRPHRASPGTSAAPSPASTTPGHVSSPARRPIPLSLFQTPVDLPTRTPPKVD